MLKIYSLQKGKILPSAEGSPLIEVYSLPDGSERTRLMEDYGIDEHTMSSAVDPDETPRIEFEDNYTAIILKYPKNYSAEDNYFFRIKSMGVFLFPPERAVVLVDEEMQLFPRRMPPAAVSGPQDVLLRILLQVMRHFEEHLQAIDLLRNELERDIVSSTDNKSLLNMFTLEKGLVYYVNALRWNSHVLEKLTLNAAKFGFDEENLALLEDIAIENNQFLEQAKLYSQVLSGMMDIRATMISNNLNIIMRNLNAVVIAISVPTFVTGLGGMSEFTAFLSFGKWYVAYPLFMLCMVLLALVVYYAVVRIGAKMRK